MNLWNRAKRVLLSTRTLYHYPAQHPCSNCLILCIMDKSGDDHASTNKVNMNPLQIKCFCPGLTASSKLPSKFHYALAPIKCYQSWCSLYTITHQHIQRDQFYLSQVCFYEYFITLLDCLIIM